MLSDQNRLLSHFFEQTKAERQEQDGESELSDSSENPAEEKKGGVLKVVSTSSVDPLYIGAREEEVLEECTGVQDSAKISPTRCDDHLTEGPGSHRPGEHEEPVAASGRTERNPDQGADAGKRGEEATKRDTKVRNGVLAKTTALETFESSDLVVL